MAVDQNEIFREATVRICSSLDLGEALQDTMFYLRQHMPLDEVTLSVYEPDLSAFRTLIQVTPDGVVSRRGQPAVIPSSREARQVVAQRIGEARWIIETVNGTAEDATAELGGLLLEQLGLSGRSFITLGNTELNAGFFFIADGCDRYTPEHARLIELLKEPFIIALSNALRYEEVVRFRDRLASENVALQAELRRRHVDLVIGAESGLKPVMGLVGQVAGQGSPVLLLGETGTGKEVIAQAIHRDSPRADGPLVTVNCGGIPETLIDSELFGYEKGAFTGAFESRQGHFERAGGGTIFLDEIGELPHAAQVKLLRVLQSKEIQRVGGRTTRRVNVRVVAATHRDLEVMVRHGQFREDLWFRLNVFPIRIPPLRERREDIPALAHHFIEAQAREMNLSTRPRLAPGSLDALLDYDWPGNVRELQNVIERSLIVSRGQPLAFPDLGATLPGAAGRDPAGSGGAFPTLDELSARHIRHALARCDGRVGGAQGAAALLGLHPSTLRARMRKLGVSFGRRWPGRGPDPRAQ